MGNPNNDLPGRGRFLMTSGRETEVYKDANGRRVPASQANQPGVRAVPLNGGIKPPRR